MGLESPVRCGVFLLVLAAVSVFFARDLLAPSPYRDAHNLVAISTDVARFQGLAKSAKQVFKELAFYMPVRSEGKLDIALASANLFEVLGIGPGGVARGNALILSETAWHREFGDDPHVVGRVLRVGGRPVVVAGVLARDEWRLP